MIKLEEIKLDDLPEKEKASIIRELERQTRRNLHEYGILKDGSEEEKPSEEASGEKTGKATSKKEKA